MTRVDSLRKPILSLILCSRNDNYMGNPRWRLQTTLNYVAQGAQELGREKDIEVVVTDWGSDVPLHTALQLSPVAASIVSFVMVSSNLARELQGDSPFSEVHALNAAARRVHGQYIGRIDQDTLVGKRFLNTFFELHEGQCSLGIPLESALLFANRRSIPYRFATRCPSFAHVDRLIRCFGQSLPVWKNKSFWPDVFWTSYVGIWLVHQNLWNECGGYNEKLIYYDLMEVDMISRLKQKYEVVDLGKLVDYDFYHLDHYPPARHLADFFATRKANPVMDLNNPPEVFHPNGKDWGISGHSLEVVRHASEPRNAATSEWTKPRSIWPAFLLLLLSSALHMGWDGLAFVWMLIRRRLRAFIEVWWHRAGVAWRKVCGQPLVNWPGLLMSLWSERQSRQGQ